MEPPTQPTRFVFKMLRSVIIPPSHPTIRRIPELPFPTYRFVPGLQEHPNLSRTHKFPPVTLEQCWDYGWDLYTHHYWWEAHEVWERLWKAMPLDSEEIWPNDHPKRRYVQGHILLSASYLLAHMGRRFEPMRAKAHRYIKEGVP